MKASEVAAYREYVAGSMDRLRRTAYLMSGDWHLADDMVSTTLAKLYRHWRRVSEIDNLDGYVRRVLLRTLLDERRRPWRREQVAAYPLEMVDLGRVAADESETVTVRMTVVELLAQLPPRRRAVLILRYFCDLSVEETAEALGCTSGTVKSQAARALATLRQRLSAPPVTEEDPLWT